MNFLALIQSLLPLVAQIAPGSSQAALLATAAANILSVVHSQTGMTTDQILQRAATTLDANEQKLLQDLARLQH